MNAWDNLSQKDMDADTWMLYQVRTRSAADYARLVAHVASLPSEVGRLDAEIKKLQAELVMLKKAHILEVEKCKHIAWVADGGMDYQYEHCVSCGRSECY